MVDVFVFGAGGLGRLVLDILRQSRRWGPVAFLDSDADLHGTSVDGLPVAGGIDHVAELMRAGVAGGVVAIGDNHTRVAIASELRQRGLRLVSAIHPLVSISPTARLGEHVIMGPRVTICVHARIGPHTVLSSGSIIEHDNAIGQGVFLHPAVRLAGTVTVEDFATLGIGACVIPGRRIGADASVAPGAVVIRDVAPATAVAGVPAVAHSAPASRFVPEPSPKPVDPVQAGRQVALEL